MVGFASFMVVTTAVVLFYNLSDAGVATIPRVVFEVTMLPGLRISSIRAISACFGPSRSMITSTIQSASRNQSKLSAKLPTRIWFAAAAFAASARPRA